jgi:plasmid maintenance system antidote protein VapI
MLNLTPLTFEDLLAIARTVRVPRALPPRDPGPGEVWRARWDDHSAVVVVIGMTKVTAEVAPCTFDVSSLDPSGLPSIDGRPLFAAWDRTTTIPAVTLDVCFGAVAVGLTAPVSDAASLLGQRLQAELSPLAALRFGEQGDGSLSALIKERALTPSAFARTLGVSPGAALNISRGKRAVNLDQARKLAQILAVSEDTVLQGNPRLPHQLIADLQEHRHRARLDQLASKRHLSDSQAWNTAAYGALLSAARHTGGEEASWHLRIGRFFESEGIRGA